MCLKKVYALFQFESVIEEYTYGLRQNNVPANIAGKLLCNEVKSTYRYTTVNTTTQVSSIQVWWHSMQLQFAIKKLSCCCQGSNDRPFINEEKPFNKYILSSLE